MEHARPMILFAFAVNLMLATNASTATSATSSLHPTRISWADGTIDKQVRIDQGVGNMAMNLFSHFEMLHPLLSCFGKCKKFWIKAQLHPKV